VFPEQGAEREISMANLRLFLATLIAVTCVGYAGTFSRADAGGSSDRALAPATGTVEVDGAHVTGQLVRTGGRPEIVITAHNPTDRAVEVKFQYAAFYTAPAPMYSRMGAMPQQIAGEECLLVAEAGATVHKRVALTQGLPPGAGDQKPEEGWSEEMWSLLVARESIGPEGLWGAVPPSADEEAVELESQQIVLASSTFRQPEVG